MIICVVVYVSTFILTFFVLNRKSKSVRRISNIKIKKNGIEFNSYYRHFINLSNAKYIMINDQIFLKYQDRRIAVKNVSDIEKVDDKLYFTCQGRVEFLYDNSAWYKFFNVIIYSDKFDLKKIKHKAMIDMVYNPLNFVEKKNFSNFIGIVKGIFRLDFKNKQMRVCANKYFLPFKMIFKLNGKIRKVSFNFN